MSCQAQHGRLADLEPVDVETAPRPSVQVEIEFDNAEIKSVWTALREGERTTAFIREAVFARVAERQAEMSEPALPEAGS